jgi:hypothetical protein
MGQSVLLDVRGPNGRPSFLHSVFVIRVLHFFTIALSLYTVAHIYSSISHDSIITETTKCTYCRKSISIKVSSSILVILYHSQESSVCLLRRRGVLSAPAGKTAAKRMRAPRLEHDEGEQSICVCSVICRNDWGLSVGTVAGGFVAPGCIRLKRTVYLHWPHPEIPLCGCVACCTDDHVLETAVQSDPKEDGGRLDVVFFFYCSFSQLTLSPPPPSVTQRNVPSLS